MIKEASYRQLRIQLICKKLIVGASLDQLISHVNSTFSKRGFEKESFDKRTIQLDIQSIREGNFEYINKDISFDNNSHVFKVKYQRASNIYIFSEDSEIPEFNMLDEGERMTLPFLIGILNPYKNIPAVKKVLLGLEDTFYISKEEQKSVKAIVIPKPPLRKENDIIALSISILGHISRNECIEFNYISVHKLDETLIQYSKQEVIPLEIRLYENLYYLIGFNKKTEEIRNYRLDQFVKLKVSKLTNSNETIYFTEEFVKSLNLKKYFQNTIGVWCHKSFETVETVEIKFLGWAATYVQAAPIHSTQVISEINKEKNELILEIKIKLFTYSESRKTARERSPELAFLLGRFREFCEVNEEKLIEKYK
ncbi:WYL domain-containing protein [Flavobacterium aciduliphilum]|uniref:WYL domain-containing protein n=1 Tax=Flavobacterium aciduliphilum TaxID=1101402 RepID=A0A328YIL2_9FLAO|nr:WYL domain-containing protein [Flavobacterium aciduliphilum]RAR73789.1 WYL domain-containing protein [Flavobacterium aciduliphilum]